MNFDARPPGVVDLLQGMPRMLLRVVERQARPRRGDSGLGALIDPEVPIFYSCVTRGARLGIAHWLKAWKRAVIFIFFTSSTERRRPVKRLRQAAVWHRLANPGHTIVFLCNTETEERLLSELGEVAVQINQNIFVSHRTFQPLPLRPVIYDAVYNARLAPFKRHHLALGVGQCAMIHYHADQESAASDAALRERHRREAPGHVFVNKLDSDGVPVLLSPQEVNAVYNQAAVGLCLSAREGAMLASMEYMLAGLPIVSTPSLGGRDVYFDEDYCIVVDPDSRQIGDAVAALKERRIPRDYIAARTREKVERDRQRLSKLVDALREDAGFGPRPLDELFDHRTVLSWRRWDQFVAELTASR